MAENCLVNECKLTCDVICKCDPNVRLCLNHIIGHIQGPGNHTLIPFQEAFLKKVSKASEEVAKIELKAREAFQESKQMIQEILDKLNLVSKNLSQRQMQLIELAHSGKLGPEVDQDIADLSEVTVSINRSQAFRRAFQRNFTVEDGDEEDAAFKVELNTLATNMNENNEIILRMVENNHIENRVITKRIRELENAPGNVSGSSSENVALKADVNELKREFKKTQEENKEMRVRIYALEKESQEAKKEVVEVKADTTSFRLEVNKEILRINEQIRESAIRHESMKQANQVSMTELQKKIEGFSITGGSMGNLQDNNEIKKEILRINNEIVEMNKQIAMIPVIIQILRKNKR